MNYYMYLVEVYAGAERRLLRSTVWLTYREALEHVSRVVWGGYEARINFAGARVGKHEDRR